MKIYRRHHVAAKITIALIIALTMTMVACSPKSSPVPSSTKTQDAAVKLVFITQPAGGEAGSVFTTLPVAALADSNGNIVTNTMKIASLTITDNSGSSPITLFGGTTVISVKGIFKFKDLCIDKVGRYTLTVTSSGLAPAVSEPFEITPSAAAGLFFSTQPGGGTAGSAFTTQPSLTILDIYGNRATSSTAEVSVILNFSLESPEAVLSGIKKVRAVNGVASFKELSIDKAGSYTLTAIIAGMASAGSATFTITPGAAAKLFFNTQPAGGPAGSPLTTMPPAIAVLVQDVYGNTVTGSTAEISLAITPDTGASGAVLSGMTKLKAVNGVADFEGLSIDKVGTGYTLTAASSGLISAVSEPFDITPSPTPTTSSSNVTAP
jgi:hypothetical protein